MANMKETKLDEDFISTAIYWGIRKCDPRFVLECIKQGEPMTRRCKNTGATFLHVIVSEAAPMTEHKFVPMIYQFSNKDVDLNAVNFNNESPLDTAIKSSLLQIMVALLKCGAETSDRHVELIAKHTRLFQSEFMSCFQKFSPGYWDAIENQKTFKVNVLIKSWCRVNLSRNNKSLIEYAKEKSAEEKIIKMLIQNEASIEFAHATIAGDRDRMQMLLCNGSVDLTTKDLSNRDSYFEPYSPLSLYGAAIKYGHKHILDIVKGYKDPFMNQKDEKDVNSVNSTICTIF